MKDKKMKDIERQLAINKTLSGLFRKAGNPAMSSRIFGIELHPQQNPEGCYVLIDGFWCL
ncbi:MAG: hypothetical protein KG029_14670 [Bacteroidetes bacterium]|nr:hypothetical protein [Bacteroidota bacterium]